MNLPNKISVARICLIPVFVVLFFLKALPYNYLIAGVVFLIAALTDFVDGRIARSRNLVTNLGKFLDPIADKVLVSTALIIMLIPPQGVAIVTWYCSIMVAIIMARELMVSAFRLIAASNGKVIAADKSGKIKTFITDVAIIILLVGAQITPATFDIVNVIGVVALGISTLLTIYSGIECLVKNKEVLSEGK